MKMITMRTLQFSTLIILIAGNVSAQILLQSEEKFHQASNLYINKNFDQALATVKEGLRAQPNSEKLEALRKLLEQEQKKQQEQQKKDQQKKEQEKKDQQKQEQQNKDQKENKDSKDQQNKDEQKKKEEQAKKEKEQQQKDQSEEKNEENEETDKKEKNDQYKPDPSKKLQEMKISEEKAKMILEAMKNQEKQYIQQQKRQATKPKGSNKPDW